MKFCFCSSLRRKSVCALLCAALVFISLAACTLPAAEAPQSTKTQLRIGVSVYDAYDTFISVLMGHFHTYVQEAQRAGDMSITVMEESAAGAQTVQNTQVESFIEAGCDVICVNLVDRAEAAYIIEAAKNADIPVLFFNRELVPEDLELWDKVYYVGAEAMQSGIIQGQLIIDLCAKDFARVDKNGDGVLQYVMLEGEAGHQDATIRTEYSVSTVQSAGYKLERLEDEIANWSRAQAETKMALWVADHGEAMEVVFANNDDMALGAIDALKKANIPIEEWPVVVGIDATPVGLAAVLEGEMYGTAQNDAYGQAKALFKLAYGLALSGAPPADMHLGGARSVRLPYNKITQDNAAYYIDV